jgi:hypothetical protein
VNHFSIAFGVVRKRPPINDFSVPVEGPVMAPDVAKIDANRHLNLGLSAWDFNDGVLRWLLHGNSLLLLRRTCSFHYRD